MASLWPLQHDNKFMHMAVHVSGLTRRFVFMAMALHLTVVDGAKELSYFNVQIVTLQVLTEVYHGSICLVLTIVCNLTEMSTLEQT